MVDYHGLRVAGTCTFNKPTKGKGMNDFKEVKEYLGSNPTDEEVANVRPHLLLLFRRKQHVHAVIVEDERALLDGIQGPESDPNDRSSQEGQCAEIIGTVRREEARVREYDAFIARLQHDEHWDKCAAPACRAPIIERLALGLRTILCTECQAEKEFQKERERGQTHVVRQFAPAFGRM